MTPWSDLKRIMSGKALSASPEVVEALAEHRANFLVRLGGTNRQIQTLYDTAVNATYSWYYTNSPAVRTVVDLLASNIAQLDLRLYDEIDTDEREEVPDHPAAYALRYPNAKMSSDQFVRYMVKSWLLYDNAFALKVRQTAGGPLQFVVLPPERVKIQGRGLQPEAYVIAYMNGAESDPIMANEMLHWRGENFEDMRIGTSRLETLRSVIAEEAAMATAIVELAKSGLAEPQWVYRPLDAPEWSNEARDRFEEDMGNRLRRSTSRPPVAEEGMELRGFGVSPKDAEMLAVRKYALQQVATAFGVPLGMVGLDPDVTSAQEEFYADTLPPLGENFCRQLNLQVVQEEFNDTELYFEFDLDEKMMGNERLKALVSASGRAVMTSDEARGKLNLPKIDGGDELVTPLNVIVGENPKPSPQVMGPQDPNAPSQEGDARQPPQLQAASLSEVLRKHYGRFATAGKDNWPRWNRELAQDFEAVGMNGDAELFAAQVNEGLRVALNNGDRTTVLNQAKADAPRLAARWVMSLRELKELGVPEELVWDRAGFSGAEIDKMRALKLAEDLASPSEIPPGH